MYRYLVDARQTDLVPNAEPSPLDFKRFDDYDRAWQRWRRYMEALAVLNSPYDIRAQQALVKTD